MLLISAISPLNKPLTQSRLDNDKIPRAMVLTQICIHKPAKLYKWLYLNSSGHSLCRVVKVRILLLLDKQDAEKGKTHMHINRDQII